VCTFGTMCTRDMNGRMDNDNEWSRVRVSPSTYACDRFSWLRPAQPGSVRTREPGGNELVHATEGKSGAQRLRRPRVDEANAVLDVQFAVDDTHRLDLSKVYMRRYYFHPECLLLNLHPSPTAFELRLVTTAQNLGVRYWWSCPICSGRHRYLYFFRISHQTGTGSSAGLLGCRQCLGLTYRSRARHRCDDNDRERAFHGDLKAAARVLSRILQRQNRDDVLIEQLRRRLLHSANDLVQAGHPPHQRDEPVGRGG
jgi:hypothetical protein